MQCHTQDTFFCRRRSYRTPSPADKARWSIDDYDDLEHKKEQILSICASNIIERCQKTEAYIIQNLQASHELLVY